MSNGWFLCEQGGHGRTMQQLQGSSSLFLFDREPSGRHHCCALCARALLFALAAATLALPGPPPALLVQGWHAPWPSLTRRLQTNFVRNKTPTAGSSSPAAACETA
jgi:hypothetical protein